jgi:hypothetical protein
LVGLAALASSALATSLATATPAKADDAFGGPSEKEKAKAYQPEEDDFSSTPFTEYGEFSETEDEEADAKFFAHGRFFGASLGLGFEGVTGNRGVVYDGGFPVVDLKLHYWFDFNFALDMNLFFASHFYEGGDAAGTTEVNIIHAGLDVKYYFDTKNLSAPLTFASPYLMLGFGSYTQAESNLEEGSNSTDTGLGLAVGAGLEFVISPKKAYLALEGRYHMVNFSDTFSTAFKTSHQVDDLTGGFYTVTASVLFTW